MSTILFLAEWALRSSVLLLAGALLLGVLRVKDASIRLTACVVMLIASLGLPLLTAVLPSVRLIKAPIAVSAPARPQTTTVVRPNAPFLARDVLGGSRQTALIGTRALRSFPWTQAALSIYFLGAGLLILRLFAGMILSRRLLRTSTDTGLRKGNIPIRESARVTSPVALGIVQPAILLPTDWREWDAAQVNAVLAHERSHIQRRDPAVQFISALHRALLWHSPLSWFLHRRLVRLAEEVSDDAAVSVTRDPVSYAELLLEFVQRASGQANRRALDSQGVAMARYGRVDARISRILEGTSFSRGVTRWGMLAVLVFGVPLAFAVAASQLPLTPAAPSEPATPAAAASPVGISVSPQTPAAQRSPVAPAAPSVPAAIEQGGPSHRTIRRYLIVSGDSMSGSWDSSDDMNLAELREKYGRHFAWFLSAGHDYVVTDAVVLEELRQAMAPQDEVNRMQDEVNKQQDDVNKDQEKVNAAQDEVNKMQDGANRRQELINQMQDAKGDEDLLRKLELATAELRAHKGEGHDQQSINREQGKVNAMQQGVNEEQGKVNTQQQKVNQEQQRVSAKYKGRIEAILESALQRRLAQEMK
jgi:hypothetical protein